MSQARVLELWQSGELVRVMRSHGSMVEVAAAIGLTYKSLESALVRLRRAGHAIPAWNERHRQQHDFADEEPTRPVIQKADIAQAVDFGTKNARPYERPLAIGMHTATVQHGVSPLDVETPRDIAQQPIAPSKWPHVEAFDAVGTPKPQSTVTDALTQRREQIQIADLKSRLKDAIAELAQCQFERDVALGASAARPDVTPVTPRETRSGLREATAVALASDWHIEETVRAAQVNGVNEYNLDIARRRVERYFAGLTYLIKYHQDHFSVRDLILWLGGDLITGYLREENLESNELSPVQAIATLLEWIPAGVRSVLDATDIAKMRIPCSSGNHGRLTEKVRPSTREANSIEWLLYSALAREFAGNDRVEFTLPAGSQTYVDVYGFVIRFTHGDETKFGGGVGGIMIPLRKAIAKWQTVRHADLNCMGHYHQEHFLRDLIVNGSLIGYSPYSLAIAAPFEDPRQAFFLVDRHRGVTFPSTIWVADRE